MYSITIWSADKEAENPTVPAITGFSIRDTGWVKKQPEEIPAQLYLSVPGIYAVCTVTVEPEPSAYAVKQLCAFAAKLAGRVNGAWYCSDGTETDAPELHFAASRAYPIMTDYSPRMTLALWFPAGPRNRAFRNPLLLALQEILPPALPAAYGETNPPDHSGERQPLQSFADFLTDCDRPVWFPHAPLGNVYLRDNPQAVPGKCGCFSLTISAAVYDASPEWQNALRRLLVRLCELYHAFFGQIIRENPGVASGVWKGIPSDLGEVCYFGGPYRQGIAATEHASETAEGIVFSEPDAPEVPLSWISFPKKTLFGHRKGENRGYALPDDFKTAADIPAECGCADET